jgi:hypothetical protein
MKASVPKRIGCRTCPELWWLVHELADLAGGYRGVAEAMVDALRLTDPKDAAQVDKQLVALREQARRLLGTKG